MSRVGRCVCGLAVACFVVRSAPAATKVRGFPVQLEGTADLAHPLAVDVDGDGKLELIAATRSQIFVLEADGSVVAGFPVSLERGAGVVTPLSVGVLGVVSAAGQTAARRDAPTLLFGTADGSLMAIGASGAVRPGFPLKLGANLAGAPTLGDLDGDGRLEILFGTRNGKLYAIRADGSSLQGFPARIGSRVSTAVTLGRFSPSEEPVLLFGDVDGRLHARTRAGREAEGFPYDARFTIASQPVLGDLDDDGRHEVAFGSKDYKIHVVESDGTAAKGYPVSTGYRIYASCALADLDGDGVVDLIVSSGDGKIYALGAGGQMLPGFPVQVGGRVRSSPVAGDVDLDGQLEIAVGSDRNRLVLLRANGKRYPGFPARMPERVVVAPLLADLTGDGLSEIVALSKDGTLAAFRMLKKGRGGEVIAWTTPGRDARRSAVFHPNPPRYVELSISPERPTTTDVLKLSYRFFDMDGDAEPDTRIRWYRDAKPVPELDGVREVPFAQTAKHQRWHFGLQAGPKGRMFQSRPVEVRNTAPGPPAIALQPNPVRTGDELVVKVVRDSKDIDDDKIRYRISWLKDRLLQKGFVRNRVTSRHTAKGQRWTVVVTPNDGEVDGQPARSSQVVTNTAPTAPAVKLVPKRPTVTQPVRIEVTRPGRDPDGDPVRYLARWWANGKPLNLPEGDRVLPAGMVAKNGRIRVEVTSFDGVERGGHSEVVTEVLNTPPKAPVIRILPAAPRTGDDLFVEVRQPAPDPDRDPIRYRFSWRRDSKAFKGTHADKARLPANETAKGERWSVVAIPHDGERDGEVARAEVTIGNTPPEPPAVAALDPRPATGADLAIRVVKPPHDPDGDPVWTEVVWSRDGRELARGRDLWKLPASRTRKHGRYLARLVPADGSDRGREVRLWFEVRNSPPAACEVAIEPSAAMTGEPLNALLTKPSSDPDGDEVQMRYRWFCDGEPVEAKTVPQRIPGKLVKRGHRWTVEATPFDGEVEGSTCRASLMVSNRPPEAARIRIFPDEPRTGDDLKLQIVKPARDADGDKVHHLIVWQRNGVPYRGPHVSSPRLPASETAKAETWTVTVTPTDGLQKGESTSASVTIRNTPPKPPQVVALRARPTTTEDLVLKVVQPAFDPDGDPVSLRVVWSNGKKDLAAEGDKLRWPAKRTEKHQRYVARLIPSDAESTGEEARFTFEVSNTPPERCTVVIEPKAPGTGQALTAKTTRQPSDVDGDRVRIRHRWYRDGEPVELTSKPHRIPPEWVKRGQRWTVVATPSDGEANGPACEAFTTIVNRPPTPPKILLRPTGPSTLDSLRLEIARPARDVDGDTVRLEISWSVDGRPFAAGDGRGPIPAGVLRKGQLWTASVVATDGVLRAKPVRAEARVLNSPPGAPRVQIRPEKPLSSDDLLCRLVAATADPDGDPVTHTYEWFRLERGRKSVGRSKAVAEGPVLASERTRRGQRWACRVGASDGEDRGPEGTAQVKVDNAAPTAPVAKIVPAAPRADEPLRCVVDQPASDPDGDRVRYRFHWTKDGVAQSFSPVTDRVPVRLTKADDIWQCRVVATDGQLSGPSADSQEVMVQEHKL